MLESIAYYFFSLFSFFFFFFFSFFFFFWGGGWGGYKYRVWSIFPILYDIELPKRDCALRGYFGPPRG